MPNAILPDNEAARLAALESYEILDTGSDWRFDSLVRLTAELYDVPITAISLIDRNRQWFKSRTGLDISEGPRSEAFCSHAILNPDEVMVVEDAAIDPRFRDNPYVTGDAGIRFYAGAPIKTPDGQALGTLCIIDRAPRTLDQAARRRLSDLAGSVGSVLDLHRSKLRLERAATHDPLTGLGNRALFDPSLETAVRLALADTPCALLYLDLDHFKAVNDRLGHAAGDAVLVEAARRMTGQVRGTDLVVRLGGDEFAILMSGHMPPTAPMALADRVCAALARPFRVEETAVSIGVSVGVAACPDDAAAPASLMRAADEALYAAKSAGRSRAVRFSDVRRATPTARHAPAADFRDALAGGGFTHHWHPIRQLANGRIVGHEAVIHWDRPGLGQLPHAEFVAFAAANALTLELDAWSLHAACAAAATWTHKLDVAVNLSAESLAAGTLPRQVATVLERTGLAADRLVIELSEQAPIADDDSFGQQIDELRGMGVRLSLDDFGIRSSLGTLGRFSFDMLKLDRAFVRDLSRNPRIDAITRAVLTLALSLGMQTCAEGVESEAQSQFLRAAGCQMAQGALLGWPGPVPQFGVHLAGAHAA